MQKLASMDLTIASSTGQQENQQQQECKDHQAGTLRQAKMDDFKTLDTVSVTSRCSNNGSTSGRFMWQDFEVDETPVSVRDMIKRYNSASSENTTAPSPTPMPRRQFSRSPNTYSGVQKMNSQMLLKNGEEAPMTARSCCRRCNSCLFQDPCMRGPPRAPAACVSERNCCRNAMHCIGNANGGEFENCGCTAFAANYVKRLCSSCELTEAKEAVIASPSCVLKERCAQSSSVESIEEINACPTEASYQSKTTIAKTSSGVRITIDIFFDQGHNMEPSDVIGNRVETDIPNSHILSEFQQQVNRLAPN